MLQKKLGKSVKDHETIYNDEVKSYSAKEKQEAISSACRCKWKLFLDKKDMKLFWNE